MSSPPLAVGSPPTDSLSTTSSTNSAEFVLVSDSPQRPRRSSVDSGHIQTEMSEVLAGLTDPSAEEWEFDEEHSDSNSEGRKTPVPDNGDAASESDDSSEEGSTHFDQSDDMDIERTNLRTMSKSEPNIARMPNRRAGRHIDSRSSLSTSLEHAHSLGSVQTSTPKSPKHDTDSTVFHGVTYLGSAMVNAPRSEVEIKRNMSILNDHNTQAIPISLIIPNTAEGIVRLSDPKGESEIATYKLQRILFCSRGGVESAERNCFAFTCSHGDNAESAMFQCHVFRCDLSDAVGKIMFCFKQSFSRLSRKMSQPSVTPANQYEDNLFTFDVCVEIKEDDGKGGFSSCPQDNGVFKMRRDLVKTVSLSLTQTSNRELRLERCFGMLVSPGRNIKNSDMHLIEMSSMGYDGTLRGYTVIGVWNPTSDNFDVLNDETPKDMRVFMTVAVDLVFASIREPVRFTLETKARIYPKSERFWYFSKKQVKEKFFMHLKPAKAMDDQQQTGGDQQYEVEKLVSETKRERQKSLSFSFNKTHLLTDGIKTPNDDNDDEESDDESPMVSGTGTVSKEITDTELIQEWADTLKKWHSNLTQRPKQVNMLCRRGIPEALRGEVWQLLAGCHQSEELIEAYRILITKDSPCEDTILRDMHRTFPAHEYFKEQGGVGQDALYKLNKAYSVYDAEVGYCQGLSFLVAALLLHMPEEQAFSVLVKIMFDYHLRNFYKDGFHDLHLKFYQLERILQQQVPDLYSHLLELQLEAHMYASQWFLTLFTAKFPLYLVYRIMDLFLCNGINTVFHVAIALLKDSRRELLALDFEGVLKFFRVTLPKKYRSEQAAQRLLDIACKTKIQTKRLQKYEQEYQVIQAAQIKQEDPVERLERENKRLMEGNMRLEQENDGLAHELVTSKVSLKNDLDTAEDSVEALSKRLEVSMRQKTDSDDMVKRLSVENTYLKEKYRTEVCAVEEELARNKEIIAQYKDICNKMSERHEKNTTSNKEELDKCKEIINKCDDCSEVLRTTEQADHTFHTIIDQSAADKDKKIRELELELAQTKLALVQIECRSQEMSHELTAKNSELQSVKNNWWNKGITTIRDAVNKKGDST